MLAESCGNDHVAVAVDPSRGYADDLRPLFGEPMQLQRQALGVRVIALLLVFLLIAYMLKKEIWKDVK